MALPAPLDPRAPAAPLLRAGAVLLVCAVVAVAANGLALVGPPTPPGTRITLVRALGFAAVALGVLVLLRQRERLRAESAPRAEPLARPLRAALLIMVVLAAWSALLGPALPGTEAGPGSSTGGARAIPGDGDTNRGSLPPPPSRGGDSPVTAGPDPTSTESLTDPVPAPVESPLAVWMRRLGGVLVLLVIVALAWVYARGQARRRGRRWSLSLRSAPEPAEDAGPPPELPVALGDDPRGRTTLAYRRLLAALAAREAGREPHEAPLEHLRRALARLHVE
ncbi:MAG: hypothetical protein KC645_19245, partial [Gemmatimonadetes bacterium]|nr:hypothetical protein [Gemmatimonadota bacterium]